jgi:glycosyltransferase involved in cell wall biosynthesis
VADLTAAPALTVVVPTVDRVDLLRRCLEALAAQDVCPPFEVLVVHDGDPGVRALLDDARAPVRGLQVAQRGASAKRNAGWRAARADVVAFTDDDCEVLPGWVAAAARALAEPDVVLAAGPVRPRPADGPADGLLDRTVRSEEPGLYPGCNLVAPVRALRLVGGFDERLSGGEDTDLAWRLRAHGRAVWDDDLVVHHAVRRVTLVAHLRSLPRWAGLPLVVRRHPQLRAHAHRRVFWKDSHPPALLALLGLAAAPASRRALLLVLPLLVRRLREDRPRRDTAVLLVTDLVETAVLTAGSVRHRSVLL